MEMNYKKLYLDHHDCTLESDYTSGYDYEMSEEYTADSYSVYLCIYAGETVDLSENIYYYTGDLDELLKEKIEECDKIYCAEEIEDELCIEWRDWCEDEGLIEWNDEEEEYEVVSEDDE